MSFRRVFQCFAITCFTALSIPHVVAAEDDGHDAPRETDECEQPSRSHDDGHDAGERDITHEHDGNRENESEDEDESDQEDCAVLPPAEVPEAAQAFLLSTSAVVTGGAAVLFIRRRSKGAVQRTRNFAHGRE